MSTRPPKNRLNDIIRGRCDGALKRRVHTYIAGHRKLGRLLAESDVVREAVTEYLDRQKRQKRAA